MLSERRRSNCKEKVFFFFFKNKAQPFGFVLGGCDMPAHPTNRQLRPQKVECPMLGQDRALLGSHALPLQGSPRLIPPGRR